MKGYVVTLLNLPESVEMAERCVASGKEYDVDIEIAPAVYKDIALEELKKEGLNRASWDESYSNIGAVIGNFVSQYRVWNKIVESQEPGIVFEHDAVVVASIPDLQGKGDIINLGKPSYGNYRKQNAPGVYPMFSKPGGYIPGAHGYYVTPVGAQELIRVAKNQGAAPCDMFLNNKVFPNIKELYPWVIEARDEFTTIQNKKGCLAKHNYDENYKLL